ATDVLLITDLSLPGVRDALRLQQMVLDLAPNAELHLATSGAIDARRSAVKSADVERTLKRKIACQIPADAAAALAAVNFGKPIPEAAPNSSIVKALRPLVARLDSPDASGEPAPRTKSMGLRTLLARAGRKRESMFGLRNDKPDDPTHPGGPPDPPARRQ